MKLDIEKEARTWIKDNYPLMNADDFDDCGELDVYDMISFAKHIIYKLEPRQDPHTTEANIIRAEKDFQDWEDQREAMFNAWKRQQLME